MARTAAREGSHEQVAQMISARRSLGGGEQLTGRTATVRWEARVATGSPEKAAAKGGGEGDWVEWPPRRRRPRRGGGRKRRERKGEERKRIGRRGRRRKGIKRGPETKRGRPGRPVPQRQPSHLSQVSPRILFSVFHISFLLFFSFFFLHMRSRNLFEFNANTHRQQQISQGPKSHRLNFVTYRQVSFFFEFFIHFDDYSQMSFSQVTSDHLSSESTESFLFYCFWLTSNNKSDE